MSTEIRIMTEKELVDILCGMCESLLIRQVIVPRLEELYDNDEISEEECDYYERKAADAFAVGLDAFLETAHSAEKKDVSKENVRRLLLDRDEEIICKTIKDVFGSKEKCSKFFSEEEIKSWKKS